MKYTWLIDAGHGGNTADGQYVTAPSKMYEHSPEEIFCEGVFNRLIKDRLMEELWKANVRAIDLCPTELDVPLTARTAIANIYQEKYNNCVGISLHSNAGMGRGFEVHTGPGETRSDSFANLLGRVLMREFPAIHYRMGDTPGEMDKDSLFYILRWTHSPWILPECLFFDNYADYLLLEDPAFRERYVVALVKFIKQAETLNI
jgi:N-acetylmuramoyl-L-alanine amidase